MANTNEAIENVKSLARTFQSVIDLANALGEVQSIEQAVNVKNVQLTRLQHDLHAAQKQLDATKDAVEAAKLSAQSITASANADREDIVGRAIVSAKEITDKAQVLRTSAEAYAKDVTAKTNHDIECINEAFKLKTQELNDVLMKIERAKAKMTEMLGG